MRRLFLIACAAAFVLGALVSVSRPAEAESYKLLWTSDLQTPGAADSNGVE